MSRPSPGAAVPDRVSAPRRGPLPFELWPPLMPDPLDRVRTELNA
jgi:hypothetical protein